MSLFFILVIGQKKSKLLLPLCSQGDREENQIIKSGEVPEDWKENPHQQDVDAR